MSRRSVRADLPHPALRRASPSEPQTHPTTRLSSDWLVASATAQTVVGLADLAVNPRPVGHFPRTPEVRPLSSTGITRLRRYYEPVRHPSAARSVPRGRPVGLRAHRWGFPCCVDLLVQTCRRHYPGGTAGGIDSLP